MSRLVGAPVDSADGRYVVSGPTGTVEVVVDGGIVASVTPSASTRRDLAWSRREPGDGSAARPEPWRSWRLQPGGRELPPLPQLARVEQRPAVVVRHEPVIAQFLIEARCGAFDLWCELADGRLRARSAPADGRCRVAVCVPYPVLLRWMSGQGELAEVVAHAGREWVIGDFADLLLVGGLLEARPWREAARVTAAEADLALLADGLAAAGMGPR